VVYDYRQRGQDRDNPATISNLGVNMDMELLAKKMRDRAIALEITDTSPRAVRKSAKLPKPVYMSVEERIEELKML
jgi:hypothetical protein